MPSAASLADVTLALPSAGELWRVLTLRAGFNTTVVVVGAAFLGMAAGVLGTFALLRRRALMGDMLSHCALPGLALAFLIGGLAGGQGRSMPVLLCGAVLSGVAGTVLLQFLVRHTRLREDTVMACVLGVFFGIGVALLSYIQTLGTGQEGGIHSLIYGQTAAMRYADARLLLALALCCAGLAALFLKEFRLVCFDSEFARVQGWNVNLLDMLMMSLVVVVTVAGIQSVGLILMVSMLIIPPAAARFWTERLHMMTLLSALIGALSGYLGACASALAPRFPAGAVIVLVSGTLFILSFLFAPPRGLIAAVVRHYRLSLRVSGEHILRTLYEGTEAQPGIPVSPHELGNAGGSSLWRWIITGLLKRRGLVARSRVKGSLVLTDSGRSLAARLTRNHRLWEEYIRSFGAVSASHVDYSADLVEHVLSADVLRGLEEELHLAGRLPESLAVPESLHRLGGRSSGD